MIKSGAKIILLIGIVSLLTSCFDKSKPNYQYFPDMYEPVSYETYGEYEIFKDGQQALEPVEESISRGWLPYDYEDNLDGYNLAKQELKNPVPYTEDNLSKGVELYDIYCATCHGKKGNGKGYLVEREKILGVPSYDDAGRAITEGSVYHVMYHGINTMGSYASQMSNEELWLVTHHVMNLKTQLEGGEAREFESEDNNQVTE
jgi:mono/diheme cytochrome c family protein